VFNNVFTKTVPVHGTMYKNMIETDRPQMTK